LVLHQDGRDLHALKVDESVKISAESAIAERIKNNTPDPGREPSLRRFIDGLISGQPDLEDMAPSLIAATNKWWPEIQNKFGGMGALKSLAFEMVNSQGADVYLATFENRRIDFLIGPLTSDHKMEVLVMRPTP
jgi:hypothetical protein